MIGKTIEGSCSECESSYAVNYTPEMVSAEIPEHCPFCGEIIDSIEEYIEDDELTEDKEWD